jgi:hypothetical protein
MGTTLNLFPARIPIGRVSPTGEVLMTQEFARALADTMTRLGGPSALGLGELATMVASEPGTDAAVAATARTIESQAVQSAASDGAAAAARIAALERRVEDLARLLHSIVPGPVDWEHPGKIGAGTANTAKFTAVTVQTLNKLTFTQPATAATYTLADGKTFTVTNSIALAGVDGKTLTLSNTLGFSGSDGAFLNIGTGGTLGSAAYASSGSFAARSSTALAAVATDPATTQALANSIRAVLISVGIGT